MSKNIDDALENIIIIKNSIGETKSYCSKLYKLLTAFGIFNLICYGMATINTAIEFILKPSIINMIIYTILNIAIYIFFFIYYMKIYKEEKASSNKYYLGFFIISAGIIFLLPLLLFMTRMIIGFNNFQIDKVGDSFIKLGYLSTLCNILLLCFCIIICGYILRKKGMPFISAVVFFIYLILSVVYNDIYYTISFSGAPITIPLFRIYYYLVVSIGYIILGNILKYGVNNTNGYK